MHVTSKADYALRAVVELASQRGHLVTRERLASVQGIPSKYLESILAELSRSGILIAKRGAHGGYLLARPAHLISVADVIRAVDGPLAGVRGERPEDVQYPESSSGLREVWIAVRSSVRAVLETTTVEDVAAKSLPTSVEVLLQTKDAWKRR